MDEPDRASGRARLGDRQGDRAGSSKAFSANLIRRGFEADRTRIGYIAEGHPLIDWMRVMCSGARPDSS